MTRKALTLKVCAEHAAADKNIRIFRTRELRAQESRFKKTGLVRFGVARLLQILKERVVGRSIRIIASSNTPAMKYRHSSELFQVC